jgi:threonine synthase
LIQPIANGALTLALDTNFDGCMRVVQEITRNQDIYLANSMNPLRIEGQKTISIEIVQQCDWEVPDWVIVPGGNLGNVSAIGYGFLMMRDLGLIARLPRLVVAQSEAANPLYLSYLQGFREFQPIEPGETAATAIRIGNPVSAKKAIRVLKTFDGIVEQASEAEMAEAAAWADRGGLFSCPHTGVALAVLIKLVERRIIRPHERVIVISTAHGLKFPDWKIKYHAGELSGVESLRANPPIEVEASYDAVMRVLEQRLPQAEERVAEMAASAPQR